MKISKEKINTLFTQRNVSMTGKSDRSQTDETRFEIVKQILTEFPALREKVLKWLQETEFIKD